MPAFTVDIERLTDLRQLTLTPRYDLQSPAVVLKYEKTHLADSSPWTTTAVDRYPATATGHELKALVLTIELQGTRSSSLRQPLKTRPLNLDNPQWWKQHLPGLENVPLEKLQITDVHRTADPHLNRELLEGTIAPWMNKTVAEDRITAKLSYQTSTETVVDRPVAIRLHVTDAPSKTYHTQLAHTPAEPTPHGLAQQLYQSVAPLQFDGQLQWAMAEVPAHPHYLGHVLNITHGQPQWQTMRALIQEVHQDVDRGLTRLQFGPARHLGPDDLIERLRPNRHRRAAHHAATRTTGQDRWATIVEQGTHSRIENTTLGPTPYQRLALHNPDHPQRIIDLDTGHLPHDLQIHLREEDVCHNGHLQKRIVFASQPFPQPESP